MATRSAHFEFEIDHCLVVPFLANRFAEQQQGQPPHALLVRDWRSQRRIRNRARRQTKNGIGVPSEFDHKQRPETRRERRFQFSQVFTGRRVAEQVEFGTIDELAEREQP